MIKHCLRFVFLAAAAFSLIHGCSDGSLECLGEAVACGDRDVGSCNHGCRVETGCLGGQITCESLTDNPDLCLQTEGCRYVGSCDGDEGCQQITNFERCGETPGCVQVRRCYGGGVTCAELDDSQCELYAQCVLGSRCTGSADSCGDLESEGACLDVPGCYSANTKPSVVAYSGSSR